MARADDEMLRLSTDDQRIAESLGIRTMEDLAFAVSALEGYLQALAAVQVIEDTAENFTVKDEASSLN